MNLIDLNRDVCSITDVGLERKTNEDNCSYLETINGFLFLVCDGIGGHVGGATASSIAVSSVVDFFNKEKYTNIKQALGDAIIFANKEIINVVLEKPELKGMGTTICVLLITGDKVWFAHVGDSRIYLFNNQQKQLHRLTKDHSIVQVLVDKCEISEEEAETHPQRNRILKALGIKNEIYPSICNLPLLPAENDVILLCTDGLTSMVNDNELQQVLEQEISLSEKGDKMLLMATQAGGIDNITFQLVKINNSPHEQSVFESKNVKCCELLVEEKINNNNENKEVIQSERKKRKKWRTIFIISALLLAAFGTFYIINNVLNN